MKRLNKLKGMYAPLIIVAAMIGITIYGSCSVDEEYDYVSYAEQEMSTRAEGVMRSGNEGNGNSYTLPSVDMIISNQSVIDSMDLAWGMTIDRLQINFQRVEHGFLIYYNPSNGSYDCSIICSSSPIDCRTANNSFTFPALPINQGFVICAFFHTHPSLRWCTGIQRETGFSHTDSSTANSLKVPILLYDYSAPIVFAGDSENDPHTLYTYDPNEE